MSGGCAKGVGVWRVCLYIGSWSVECGEVVWSIGNWSVGCGEGLEF